jgi:hypothetical protein
MTNPANVALYAHRSQLWLRNTTSGSEIVLDRFQTFDPTVSLQTDPYHEIGRVGQIGVTQGPPDITIQATQNVTQSMELEFLLSNQVSNPSIGQQVNLGQIVLQADLMRAYQLMRNNDDTLFGEQEYGGLSVSSLEYAFTIGGACTLNIGWSGRTGKFYTSGSLVHSWGALDNASFGGIHGKDAVVYLSSGSAIATDKAYRVQSFTIRANFPVQIVKEIGLRDNVGTVADSPDVTVEFDILTSDTQPTALFFQDAGSSYSYANPAAAINVHVRLFNPDAAEYAALVRAWRIDNCKVTSHQPARSQVRGLTTSRYSLIMSAEAVADTGGLLMSNRNDL